MNKTKVKKVTKKLNRVLTLRISPELHRGIKGAAKRSKTSINQLVITQLERFTWDEV
jgi:predicted HicB family RNase H-like nuclease